mgnify:CR=1 FL=1
MSLTEEVNTDLYVLKKLYPLLLQTFLLSLMNWANSEASSIFVRAIVLLFKLINM